MMKDKKYLKIFYILSACSFFLPWFTYNARVMGYCWGYYFLKWFLVPMAVLAVCLFQPKQSKLLLICSELSLIANLAILAVAFGKWQEVCNINSGFHWEDGLHTAMPTYWIAVVLFLLFFILFQIALISNALRKK